jgi:hypothetical protein|tara:strand:- start:522 stop:887 length:366 start_codon:yes stop_codon:yes gene_type:complete
MATYAWTIDKLYTKNITESGTTYSDVITRVEATLTATSETVGSISVTHGANLDMDVSNVSNSFTAYSSVTEANVKSWVETRITSDILTNIKTDLENNLTYLENINGSVAKEDSDGNSTFPW